MADYIILAATTALKSLGVPTLPFCGGRTDAGEAVIKQEKCIWLFLGAGLYHVVK